MLKNNVEVLNGSGGGKVKLLNIVMQLRKASNHPYLFDGTEDKTARPRPAPRPAPASGARHRATLSSRAIDSAAR